MFNFREPSLFSKHTCFSHSQGYMQEHLLTTGENLRSNPEEDALVRLPYLRTWFRTKSAMVLHLSNGIVQVDTKNNHLFHHRNNYDYFYGGFHLADKNVLFCLHR